MITKRFKQQYVLRVLFVLLALLIFSILIAPQEGRAASTIVVNSQTDAFSNDGACTLREAVIAANRDKSSGNKPGECIAGSGTDTIMLPAGTFSITRSDAGNEDSSATGDLDITGNVAIVGAGANTTLVVGVGITDRLFHVISGQVTISNLAISGGNVPQNGGGLYNQANLTLSGVSISGNHAQGNGAGLFNVGTLVMRESTVVGNTAVLDNHELANTGTATLRNSTISGHGLRSSGTTTVSYMTIVGETAVNSGTFNANNSILTACTGTIVSQGHNIIANTTGCSLSGVLTGNILNRDPALGVLTNNGGPTLTHALLDTSPAVEAGNNALCPATDQRGVSRPRGAFCDIGAYESEDPQQNGPTAIVNTANDSDDGTCSLLHCTLREAINAADNTADTIRFNITGSGPYTIAPLSPLPALTRPVTLDGSTQPGGTVTLDGSVAGPTADGLTLSGGNSVIRGLTITNFACTAVVLDGAGDNFIVGNTLTQNGCHGIQVLSGSGNTFQNNSISANGLLAISLASSDAVTPNDIGDGDAGANEQQNFPVLSGAVASGSGTLVTGRLNSSVNTTFTLEFFGNSQCDSSQFGEGETSLGTAVVTTDSKGNVLFAENTAVVAASAKFVTATATDSQGNTSELSQCVIVGPKNDSWPQALRLNVAPNFSPTAVSQFLDQQNQSRWYKFTVQPNSRLIVTVTDLPSNYDLTLYKDIAAAFAEPQSSLDLALLGAEFAPDAFSPDAFSPDAFSPDAFSPDAFSPDAFSPDAFSPDAFSPDAFSPDAFSPDAFSPDAFSPDAFSPDAFSPDAFSPDAFSPDAFSPDAFSPDAFSSAQTRSLIAISAFEGTAGEGVSLNTWNNATDFYIRVRGRQGAFSLAAPFQLSVQLQGNGCGDVGPIQTSSTTTATANNYKTIILTDFDRMNGTTADQLVLETRLAEFAAAPEVAGAIVDLSADAKVTAAHAQADAHTACPYAENLVGDAIKEIIDRYRVLNPNLSYVVLLGSDRVIPFFRYPDQALLANEKNYVPPVLDSTASQASLKLGYILTQDNYGAAINVSSKSNEFPVPDLAVGRLVETMAEATIMLDAYLDGTQAGVVPTPSTALVSGYDFLADAADAVKGELEAGLGTTADSLILPRDISPDDPQAWTAEQLTDLLYNGRHDLMFLAAHFSANSMLAADYDTRLLTDAIINAPVDLTNSIVFSAGCHAAYNIVNEHAVPNVTAALDWTQAFAQRGATLIAGTGYQYGDTDFIKYSERLYWLFSQQLRTGSGAVSVGQALVAAKQEYLATTPEMRGIDQKSVLEAAVFGLPMLSVNMPGARLPISNSDSLVNNVHPFSTNPGAALGLEYADVTVPFALSAHNVTLTDVKTGAPIDATYFSGPDGVVSNPAEVVLPLAVENVSVPNTVLRGVGFRGGSYDDVMNVLPLTGAATTEIRGVHAPFLADVFYPVQLWRPNYFGLLADPSQGTTQLLLTPAHFRSATSGATRGTWRTFDEMNFRLYYSDNVSTYGGGSVPALAAAPTIVKVTAVADAGQLHFTARVIGNPAAGIQEVWVTHTDNSAVYPRQWQSLDLTQNGADSTMWEGTLPLNGTPATAIRYMVQAVNGVGLVSLDTNQGAYYQLGTDTPVNAAPTSLTLELSATSGAYSTPATASAVLSSEGAPLANRPVFFKLGPQSRQAMTDSNGRATVTIPLLGLPGAYQMIASFPGDAQYLSTTTQAAFTINKQATQLTLQPQPATGQVTDDDLLTATLLAGGRRLIEKSIFFVISGAGGEVSTAVITNNKGEAVLGNVQLPAGTYSVKVYFSGNIPLPGGPTLTLDDERYLPAMATGSLTLLNTPPQAVNDAYETNEDVTLVISAPGVLANDIDANGDGLTAELVTTATHGAVTLAADGSFTYVPEANYQGADSFTYRAHDGTASGNTATVNITVQPVNDAPLAAADSYQMVANTTLSVAAPGVLTNDSDPEGNSLTAVLLTNPSHGTVALNGDGSFNYTPASGFVGEDAFTYQANDGNDLSAAATVTITVLPGNQAPNCSQATSSITYIWPPDKNFVPVNILNVTDSDGGTIAITINAIRQDERVGFGSNSPDGEGIGTNTAYVRAERDGNGNGRVYHITFTANDGQGGSCSATLRLPVVTHDQSGDIDQYDGGPLYDSTVSG